MGDHRRQQALGHSHMNPPQRDADQQRAPVAAERQHDIGEDQHQQPPLQQFAVAHAV